MVPSHVAIVRVLVLGFVPVALGACTLVGAVPAAPAPRAGEIEADRATPSGPAVEHAADEELGESPERDDSLAAERITADVVRLALESIGAPYEWGGTDANGFDCSGLIQFAYGRLGISLPRRSTAQIRAGSRVDPDRALLRRGDILGFSADRSGTTSHVGLYIGDDEFIHSGSSGVRISSLRDAYWRRSLVAARRIVG